MITFKNNSIIVFQSSFFKMNSTVITTEDLVIVVDPGYHPNEIEQIRQYVDKIKRDKPIYVLFTHSDFDHIVGYGAFPDAKTIASQQFVESRFKVKQLRDIVSFDDELYIDRQNRIEYPKIDITISSDGEELKIGETSITFYHAFGHTDDGLLTVIDDKNLLISGDYLSDLEFPFVYYRFSEYKNTLNRCKLIFESKSNLILISGHGRVTEDPLEIQQRIKASEDYFMLIESNLSKEGFRRFLVEKGYTYVTNLTKRHQENLMVWKEEQS
ncbi:MBL fold metallo-hydrolase [Bacillus sp. EB600]|uniref:MBL fold metallo-hydrolase n=1 Tax=Bacillus sp. EB600 TaxID=2806345 RepID=UPI00210BE353|nr:MBL fold metallo-hydrolase [Bacillus sp. EB600]MCQ6277701.1 MBL fold metallo-hydrolase [Bacillus sp. EB600]